MNLLAGAEISIRVVAKVEVFVLEVVDTIEIQMHQGSCLHVGEPKIAANEVDRPPKEGAEYFILILRLTYLDV